MKLSEMRELLDRRDIQLTKSLGQNFLHDTNQLERIVAAAALTETDKTLEIGPGLGPLTEHLLKRGGKVLAIEKDNRLVAILRERFSSFMTAPGGAEDKRFDNQPESPRFQLIHADALEFLKREQRDWSDWKMVANLPYSVASPILVELAAGIRSPKMIVATLQYEVAQRVLAEADQDDYGVLTLLIQLDFRPRGCFKIPPGCFFPSPDVDSACVILERREKPLLSEDSRAIFSKIVKRAFSQRRKMMLKLLKQDWPREKLEAAFELLKISHQERAEKLSLEQFLELTKLIAAENDRATNV